MRGVVPVRGEAENRNEFRILEVRRRVFGLVADVSFANMQTLKNVSVLLLFRSADYYTSNVNALMRKTLPTYQLLNWLLKLISRITLPYDCKFFKFIWLLYLLSILWYIARSETNIFFAKKKVASVSLFSVVSKNAWCLILKLIVCYSNFLCDDSVISDEF